MDLGTLRNCVVAFQCQVLECLFLIMKLPKNLFLCRLWNFYLLTCLFYVCQVFSHCLTVPNLEGISETLQENNVHRREFQRLCGRRMFIGRNLNFRMWRMHIGSCRGKSSQLWWYWMIIGLGRVRKNCYWSRASLEKILFEGEGDRTLGTTRDCSTTRRTTSSRLYELPLLDDADALSLFSFWTFGQRSIPTTADEHFVKQVQGDCKGLPLVLKLIGSSLHGKPRPVWESASKNKLLNGESISDYHKEKLHRCFETSIEVLDGETRECFLDVGSFPENRKISVNALSDIWVYVRKMEGKDAFVILVRKMEWKDAFVILLELASRNLLNLTSNLRCHGSKMNFHEAEALV